MKKPQRQAHSTPLRADQIDRREETRRFNPHVLQAALKSAGVLVPVSWLATLRRADHMKLVRFAEQVSRRGHATVTPQILLEGMRAQDGAGAA